MKKNTFITLLFLVAITVTGFAQKKGYYINLDGKNVFVQDNSVSTTIASPDDAIVNSDNAINNHTVKRGESLYSISRLYSLTVEELARLNNFSSDKILDVGEELKVSNFAKTNLSSANASFHIVVKKDTLYSLAKRYGITVEKLRELNYLDSNLIFIGQKLMLN